MNKGQSLFEVVFAVGIAGLIVTGIVSLANRTLGNSNTSRDRSLASRYAQDMTDCLRELRDEDFAQWEIREYAKVFKKIINIKMPELSKIWFQNEL